MSDYGRIIQLINKRLSIKGEPSVNTMLIELAEEIKELERLENDKFFDDLFASYLKPNRKGEDCEP